MSIDEQVVSRLSELTEELTPLPDPHGRVQQRYRRSQRRRRSVVALGLAGVMAAAAPLVLPPRDGLSPAGSDDRFRVMLQWAEKLADAPTMGKVGEDKAFVASLIQRITDIQKSGGYHRSDPVREVKVPFVDDIGPHRVAFVVFELNEPQLGTKWPNVSGWFVGARGDDAEQLSSPASLAGIGDGLEPFAETTIGSLGEPPYQVALAPPGCAFSSAELPAVTNWQPEPTVSYLVRTPETVRREWWRVTCGNIVRWEQPTRTCAHMAPTQQMLDDAVKYLRGQLDPQRVRNELSSFLGGDCNTYSAPPSLLWSGRLSGTDADSNTSYDGNAVVAVAPTVRGAGAWAGRVSVTFDTPRSGGAVGAGDSFAVDFDPTKPSSVLAIHVGRETSNVLVLAPLTGVSMRVIDRLGNELVRVPLQDAAAFVKVSDPNTATFEVLDGAGKVIGSAKVNQQDLSHGYISNWDTP